MVVVEQRRKGEHYTEAEIDRGLAEVAVCGGNTRRASRRLETQGLPIPRETLKTWATELHARRYEEIRAELLPRIREAACTAASEREVAA